MKQAMILRNSWIRPRFFLFGLSLVLIIRHIQGGIDLCADDLDEIDRRQEELAVTSTGSGLRYRCAGYSVENRQTVRRKHFADGLLVRFLSELVLTGEGDDNPVGCGIRFIFLAQDANRHADEELLL